MMKSKKAPLVEINLKKFKRHENPDGTKGGLISPKANIGKNVWIDEETIIGDGVEISDNASIFGKIIIRGQTEIAGHTLLESYTSGNEYWIIEDENIKRSIQKYWPRRCRNS